MHRLSAALITAQLLAACGAASSGGDASETVDAIAHADGVNRTGDAAVVGRDVAPDGELDAALDAVAVEPGRDASSPSHDARAAVDAATPPADGGACLPAYGSFRAGNWPPGCWRPYADTSPLNRAIPPSPRLVANSSAIVHFLHDHWGNPSPTNGTGTADTPNDYWHPIYYPQPTDPLFTLHCTQPWGTCAVEGMSIRIPDAARAAGGTDGHLTVIDQASGWEVDLWTAQDKPAGGGRYAFGWGGRTRIDGDGRGSGATASGFGNLGGIVRAQELEAGEIRHALFAAFNCFNGTRVYPATGDDGMSQWCSSRGLSNADAPAYGAHFQLDMTDAEIDALAAPGWQKTLLRAMAHYGIYYGDSGDVGGAFGLSFESGSTYTSFGQPDAMVTYARSHGIAPSGSGRYPFDYTRGVDWTRLRVLDPCVAEGSCP